MNNPQSRTEKEIDTALAQIPLVDLKAQYASIRDQVDAAILRCLEQTDFILGEAVERFEEEFARYVEADYAVGVASGTDALELALRAVGVGPGDEVVVPAMTFAATALAVARTGATVVFADVNAETATLDAGALAQAVTSRTKAVIPVHLYGRTADLDAILSFARRHRVKVVEDACQAHGALYRGRRVGALGDAGAFSFYPGKNLGAYGDGGMVVTRDAAIAHEIRTYRNYGQEKKHHHRSLGTNSRLDSLQAAVLAAKLPHLDEWNEIRRAIAAEYSRRLSGLPLVLPQTHDCMKSVWHLYAVRTALRDELLERLRRRGIGAGVHYPVPVHLQECFRNLRYGPRDFPVAEAIARETLSLPMYPELTEAQLTRVVKEVRRFFEEEDGNPM